MTNLTVRVTKAQKFEAIIDILREADFEPIEVSSVHLKDGSVREGITMDADYLIDFCKSEIEALARKKTSERKNPNEEKNEEYRNLIVEYLSVQDEGKSGTDMILEIPEFTKNAFSNQKVSRLISSLIEQGMVTKKIVKGTTYYSMA